MNHWSWSKNNHWVFFSTYIADDNGYNGNRIAYAKQLANEIFASDPSDVVPIEVHRVTVPNIQPYCKNSADDSMAKCTDQEIDASGGTLSRMELSVPVGGPNCQRHSTWSVSFSFCYQICHLAVFSFDDTNPNITLLILPQSYIGLCGA